jgi:NADPH-dependent 2,4-dienoyl-CoA reductase/sulfur reductase-like enzyme
MGERTDVVIVGGGPAGLTAALEAERHGLSVLVLDENARTGGQIHRQPSRGAPPPARLAGGRQTREGRELIARVAGSDVRVVTAATVWGSLEPGSLEVHVGERNQRVEYEALVVATGAYDRPVPVPGWTLPGVITAGGAQALMKGHGVVPGRRILLAGAGPLQLVVASQLVAAGATVVAVAEVASMGRHLRRLGPLLAGGSNLLAGMRYRWSVLRAGTPWIAPAVITRIEGERSVERATIARIGPDWRPIEGTEVSYEVDTVCLGYGLVPSVELLRHLGSELVYDPVGAAWVPVRDERLETSLRNVYAVGDGAGVAGVSAAGEEGRLAGLAVAARLRPFLEPSLDRPIRKSQKRLAKLRRFARALQAPYALHPGIFRGLAEDTTICRCEEVVVGEVRRAIEAGATELVQLKASTRLGMGPCQGKMCSGAAAHLLAEHTGRPPGAIAALTARPPLRPVPIRSLLSAPDA